jgi:hypothetical protein
MASAGLDGSRTFHTGDLDADARAAFEQGLGDSIAHLDDVASDGASSTGMFGTRQEMAGLYDNRNVGANKGLYGLPPAIAWYGGWLVDSAGNHITGRTDYTITFTADQLPKARFFWSATLYTIRGRYSAATQSTDTPSATAPPASTTATTDRSPSTCSTTGPPAPRRKSIGCPHRKVPSPSSSGHTAAMPQSPKGNTDSRR